MKMAAIWNAASSSRLATRHALRDASQGDLDLFLNAERLERCVRLLQWCDFWSKTLQLPLVIMCSP